MSFESVEFYSFPVRRNLRISKNTDCIVILTSQESLLLAFLDFKEYGLQHKTDITSTPLNYQHSKTSTDCTWKGMALFELINCKVQPSQKRPIAYFLEFRQTHIELSSANQGNLTKRKIERPFFILIKWNTINKFATTKKRKKMGCPMRP